MRSLILFMVFASLSFSHALSAADRTVATRPEYPGDKEYFNFVDKGRKLEANSRLKEALDQFNQALRVKRYEIPSYYVLLDIGRVKYKIGDYKAAIKTSEDYLEKIAIELKVQKGEMMPPGGLILPAYTEAGLKDILADKAEAEAIIVASKARLAAQERKKR